MDKSQCNLGLCPGCDGTGIVDSFLSWARLNGKPPIRMRCTCCDGTGRKS